jgi:hypothetical protein
LSDIFLRGKNNRAASDEPLDVNCGWDGAGICFFDHLGDVTDFGCELDILSELVTILRPDTASGVST